MSTTQQTSTSTSKRSFTLRGSKAKRNVWRKGCYVTVPYGFNKTANFMVSGQLPAVHVTGTYSFPDADWADCWKLFDWAAGKFYAYNRQTKQLAQLVSAWGIEGDTVARYVHDIFAH